MISIKITKKYDPKAREGPRSRLSIAFVPEKRKKKIVINFMRSCAEYKVIPNKKKTYIILIRL